MSVIARMRHRIGIESPSTIADGAGGESVSWTAVATVWATVVPLTGTETQRHDRFAGTLSHRITIRYRDDVVPAMRFTMGTRIFRIAVVRDLGERRRWLECICEEEKL